MVHDISQSILLIPNQMLSQQPPSHYASAALQMPSAHSGRKRSRSVSEGDDDETNPHIAPHLSVLSAQASSEVTHSPELLFSVHGGSSRHNPASSHGFAPTGSMTLLRTHHHHRLPPRASLQSAQRHGFSMASSQLPSGPPSVVGQPGMPEPASRPRGPKLKFTPEEDALLVELKENKNLTWKQIADFFPGRTSGTLQVRYCTKLKAKDAVWTDDTVQRLQHAIQEYENDRWRIVAGKVGNGFTPAACREKASEL